MKTKFRTVQDILTTPQQRATIMEKLLFSLLLASMLFVVFNAVSLGVMA